MQESRFLAFKRNWWHELDLALQADSMCRLDWYSISIFMPQCVAWWYLMEEGILNYLPVPFAPSLFSFSTGRLVCDFCYGPWARPPPQTPITHFPRAALFCIKEIPLQLHQGWHFMMILSNIRRLLRASVLPGIFSYMWSCVAIIEFLGFLPFPGFARKASNSANKHCQNQILWPRRLALHFRQSSSNTYL